MSIDDLIQAESKYTENQSDLKDFYDYILQPGSNKLSCFAVHIGYNKYVVSKYQLAFSKDIKKWWYY